jgi:hypothetical protein
MQVWGPMVIEVPGLITLNPDFLQGRFQLTSAFGFPDTVKYLVLYAPHLCTPSKKVSDWQSSDCCIKIVPEKKATLMLLGNEQSLSMQTLFLVQLGKQLLFLINGNYKYDRDSKNHVISITYCILATTKKGCL